MKVYDLYLLIQKVYNMMVEKRKERLTCYSLLHRYISITRYLE